jgi:hypothetical protein
MGDWAKLAKKAKHSDAVMTGILVTRFKMGQIDIEDLEEMAADTTRPERCSAAKKVLVAVRDSPDRPCPSESLSPLDSLLQKS